MSMLCVVLPILFAQPPFESNPSPNREGPERGQDVAAGVAGEFRLAPVPGMTIEAALDQPGAIRVFGHVGFQVEGNRKCTKRAYTLQSMTGIDVAIDGKRIPGTYATENWARHEHYHDMPFAATVELDPGTYLIEVRGETITLSPNRNSCAVYFKQAQYHSMTVEILQPCG
jgi:hypothetical protein